MKKDTFLLCNGVEIYGGFVSGGVWEERNPNAHKTILSGDIGSIDYEYDNSYHVVTASGTDSTAVLNGFTVCDGGYNLFGTASGHWHYGGGMYNLGGSPTIANCTFSGNKATEGEGDGNCDGGGMYNKDGSPTITNCIFNGNEAEGGQAEGGGMYNENCNSTITNCTFSLNLADNMGGGMYNAGGSPTITNCTLTANLAKEGGGVYNDSTDLTINNCIIWGNSAGTSGPQIGGNLSSPDLDVTYSNIQCVGVWPGEGNINAEPLFVDGPLVKSNPGSKPLDDYGDLRLQSGSPCIDTADDSAAPNPNKDITGFARVDIPGVGIPETVTDMGAFEYDPDAGVREAVTIHVKTDGDDSKDGLSWTNAKQTLQAALDIALANDEIWVAAGTYKPSKLTDPGYISSATFQLINKVAIYGGFVGGEISRNERNLLANETILSGNIGGLYDNARHIVTGSGTDKTAVLDGFTITFSGTVITYGYKGSGILNDDGSPTVTNCTFTLSDGSAMYNNHGSCPIVTNCTFTANETGDGGAMYNQSYSSPVITNCEFFGNTGTNDGGAIYNNSSSPTITNSTFSNNIAWQNGGAIYNMNYSSPTITNCILWENNAISGSQIYNHGDNSYPVITYSDIEGGWGSSQPTWNPDYYKSSCEELEFNMNFEDNPTATTTRAVRYSSYLSGTLNNYDTTGWDVWDEINKVRGTASGNFGPTNDLGAGAQGDCYISFSDNSCFDIGSSSKKRTWAFWFNAPNLDNGTIISRCSSSAEDRWWEIRIKNGKLEFCHGLGYLTMETTSSLSNLGVTADNWHHAAVVIDRETQTTSKIYINGREVPVAIKAYNSESGSDISSGIQFGAGQYEFDGLLDEVRLYKRPLAPSEVSILYHNQVPFAPVPAQGDGNIDADPVFVEGGNKRLEPGSPCIDTGYGAAIPPDYADLDGDDNITEQTPLDLDLLDRFINGIDMGAYENNYDLSPYPVIVSAGARHSLFIKGDSARTVWGCGDNKGFEDEDGWPVGTGAWRSAVQPPQQVLQGDKNYPVDDDYLEGISSISAGSCHSLAVGSDGSVWAWGRNTYGQIGVGGSPDPYDPIIYPEPVKVESLSGITKVSASTGSELPYSLALDESDNVWAWGRNEYTTYSSEPGWSSSCCNRDLVACGESCVPEYGICDCWGFGQLGIGNYCAVATPHQVLGGAMGTEFLEGIVDICAALTHSIACDDLLGNVWTWGYNWNGELGNGYYSAPTG